MLLASRQAGWVENDDSYWPNGFFAEFAEFVAMLEVESDEELRSAKLAEMHRRAAEELTADAIAQPRRALGELAGQQAAFEARLEARWGRGLDLADLVVQEAFKSGWWANHLLGTATATRTTHKFEALIRLHGKAVMTAREVLVLLRSGYSSGALSRWRTLHEVWVVFDLLTDGDEDLSRRYLAHEVVESLKGQKEYEETWEARGDEPPDWTAAEREHTRAELAAEFGSTFLDDYGWAAALFNGKAPKFRQLQERAELDHWRGYYRMASHGTHANPKGISWNIQDLLPTDLIWAGPSNAGLVEPAQCSLIALAGVTASLIGYAFGELPDSAEDGILDQSEALVRLQAIGILKDLAIETLVEVHAQQEAEEEALADLVDRATTVLGQGTPATAERLAAELDVDIEDLAGALEGAVARGELLQETRYRMDATDDEISEGVAPE